MDGAGARSQAGSDGDDSGRSPSRQVPCAHGKLQWASGSAWLLLAPPQGDPFVPIEWPSTASIIRALTPPSPQDRTAPGSVRKPLRHY